MTPVMFAYGGWQTASFISGELARPAARSRRRTAGRRGRRDRGLRRRSTSSASRVLGPDGWPPRPTPASTVMRSPLGERGATLIAAGIAISTLGLSQPGHAHRAARLLRDGRGRRLLPRAWPQSTPRRACRSSPSRCRASWRSSSRSPARYEQILELRRLGRFHLLRPDRRWRSSSSGAGDAGRPRSACPAIP